MIRRCVIVLAIASLLVPGIGATYTPTAFERYAQGGLNGVRSFTGRAALTLSGDLSACAHRHSANMASHHKLYHSSCSKHRENIGYAGSLDKILRMWLGSSVHRANMMCGCSRVAVGVYRTATTFWVTEIYW